MRTRVRLWLNKGLSNQDIEDVVRRVTFLRGRVIQQSNYEIEAEFPKWGLIYRLVLLRGMKQVDQVFEEPEDPSWLKVGIIFIHDSVEFLSELVTNRFRRIFKF